MEIFRSLGSQYREPQVDLFTSSTNHLLSLVIIKDKETPVSTVDSFMMDQN